MCPGCVEWLPCTLLSGELILFLDLFLDLHLVVLSAVFLHDLLVICPRLRPIHVQSHLLFFHQDDVGRRFGNGNPFLTIEIVIHLLFRHEVHLGVGIVDVVILHFRCRLFLNDHCSVLGPHRLDRYRERHRDGQSHQEGPEFFNAFHNLFLSQFVQGRTNLCWNHALVYLGSQSVGTRFWVQTNEERSLGVLRSCWHENNPVSVQES